MKYDSYDHDKCPDRTTVVVDGIQFTVAASILKSRSKYFSNIFTESFLEREDRRVDIPGELGISSADFDSFLRHIYGEPMINGETYLSLLKSTSKFEADDIFGDIEDFIIKHCCPEIWSSYEKKQHGEKPFCIHLLEGIELAFAWKLDKTKAHMQKMLGQFRLHTFLKLYPEMVDLKAEIRLWVMDTYARQIMASQTA